MRTLAESLCQIAYARKGLQLHIKQRQLKTIAGFLCQAAYARKGLQLHSERKHVSLPAASHCQDVFPKPPESASCCFFWALCHRACLSAALPQECLGQYFDCQTAHKTY